MKCAKAKTRSVLLPALTFYAALNCAQASAGMKFVHPGAVHNKADLDFVAGKIASNAQPWTGKFNALLALATPYAKGTAPLDGFEDDQKADAIKAYANALAWYYTGKTNTNYAGAAKNVLNTWATTFKGYAVPPAGTGNQSQLNAAWIGALMGSAAEIMREDKTWSKAEIRALQKMFTQKFYPALNQMSPWNGNVDLTQIDAIMNLAVFNEDEAEFNLGLTRLTARNPNYFYLSTDKGIDYSNWFKPVKMIDGLGQESCRLGDPGKAADNGHHMQFAMASTFRAAEVAWNQGVDYYGANATRYTAMLELLAKQEVTGSMQGACSDDATNIDLFDTFEIGYNHYHNRKGMNLPNTAAIIASTRTKKSDWNIFYESLTHGGLPAKSSR